MLILVRFGLAFKLNFEVFSILPPFAIVFLLILFQIVLLILRLFVLESLLILVENLVSREDQLALVIFFNFV